MTLRSLTCTLAAALVTALSLACDVDETDLTGEAEVLPRGGGSGSGPPFLNTWKLYGSAISNVDTHGNPLEGVTLLGVMLDTGSAYEIIDDDSLTVDHGALRATVNGYPRPVNRFLDSLWFFEVASEGGSEVVFAQLTAIAKAGDLSWSGPNSLSDIRMDDPERDVYTFKYHINGDPIASTCDPDENGSVRTYILGDIFVDHDTGDITSRPNTLYLGCTSGAVAKAVEWGFAPDNPSITSVSLAAYETAVRAVRQDYCADGTSHTTVGKEIAIRDRWIYGPFAPMYSAFTTETVWEEGGGALCVRKNRATGAVLQTPVQCPGGTQIPLCPNEGSVGFAWNFGDYGDFWIKTEDAP